MLRMFLEMRRYTKQLTFFGICAFLSLVAFTSDKLEQKSSIDITFRGLEDNLHQNGHTDAKVKEEADKPLDKTLAQLVAQRCQESPEHTSSFQDLTQKHKEIVYKHLLVSDQFKFIYCYVPKVACSNWKKTYLRLHGQHALADAVHLDHARGFKHLSEYSEEEIQFRLSNYFKFTFVRHPMERALSGYRNKFGEIKSFYSVVGKQVSEMYHKHKQTTYPGKVPGDDVTFADFLRYVTEGVSHAEEMDEHFMPMHLLCQPCALKYDFIGTYQTIIENSEKILKHVGGPEDVHFPQQQNWYRPTSDNYVHYYYSLQPAPLLESFRSAYGPDFKLFGFQSRNLTYAP